MPPRMSAAASSGRYRAGTLTPTRLATHLSTPDPPSRRRGPLGESRPPSPRQAPDDDGFAGAPGTLLIEQIREQAGAGHHTQAGDPRLRSRRAGSDRAGSPTLAGSWRRSTVTPRSQPRSAPPRGRSAIGAQARTAQPCVTGCGSRRSAACCSRSGCRSWLIDRARQDAADDLTHRATWRPARTQPRPAADHREETDNVYSGRVYLRRAGHRSPGPGPTNSMLSLNATRGSEYTYAVKLEDCGGADLRGPGCSACGWSGGRRGRAGRGRCRSPRVRSRRARSRRCRGTGGAGSPCRRPARSTRRRCAGSSCRSSACRNSRARHGPRPRPFPLQSTANWVGAP